MDSVRKLLIALLRQHPARAMPHDGDVLPVLPVDLFGRNIFKYVSVLYAFGGTLRTCSLQTQHA
jgi:hypothetical protein